MIFYGRRPEVDAERDQPHRNLALGAGWFVHSSGQGTTIAPSTGWYRSGFAWGRRPLREAGLG